MDPLIQEGAQRQSQLEAAKASFFSSGGKTHHIAIGVGSGNLSQLTPHHQPPLDKAVKPRRPGPSAEQRRKREVLSDAIRHCIEIEHLTQLETAAAVGVCRNKVVAIVKEFSIKYSRKKCAA